MGLTGSASSLLGRGKVERCAGSMPTFALTAGGNKRGAVFIKGTRNFVRAGPRSSSGGDKNSGIEGWRSGGMIEVSILIRWRWRAWLIARVSRYRRSMMIGRPPQQGSDVQGCG
jgi:hypothetical protein